MKDTKAEIKNLLLCASVARNHIDSSTTNTPASIKISKNIHKALILAFEQKDNVVTIHSIGHFYCFGFVRNVETSKCVYFNSGDYRSRDQKFLYRVAKNTKDYSGEMNQYCSWIELPYKIANLIGVEL